MVKRFVAVTLLAAGLFGTVGTLQASAAVVPMCSGPFRCQLQG